MRTLRTSEHHHLRRAFGHPLAEDIPRILSDERLSRDAKLLSLALLSLADPDGWVRATEQEIVERTAAIQDEIAEGGAGMLARGG